MGRALPSSDASVILNVYPEADCVYLSVIKFLSRHM
jgi:hypothetical protein